MGMVAPPLKRVRTGLQTAKDSKREWPDLPVTDLHQQNPNKKSLKIQECSFIKWHVSGITSVAATPSGRYVALARLNGTIELRDEKAMWATVFLLHPANIQDSNNVVGMAFSNCGRYLFAAYLLGVVDILKVTSDGLERHTTIHPGGGAIWDIAANRSDRGNSQIAIACDDGCVRIITPDFSFAGDDSNTSLPSDPVHYEVMATEKTSARVLSLCWSPEAFDSQSSCIVCGDDEGGVRWLNASNGSSFGKGKIRSTRGEKAMIWTLQFVDNGREVVCGDSRGLATVWSSATNTMNAEIRIEGMRGALWSSVAVADVATADDNESEFVIFGSAGGGIGGLKKVGKDEPWTPLRAVQLHTHDVRGMCHLSNGMLLSGSMDSLMRSFSPVSLIRKKSIKWIRPYNECVSQPPVQFCPGKGIVMARIARTVELWSLSEDAHHPSLLLRMNVNNILGDLRSCAISKDCQLVAVSAVDCLKFYRIWDGQGGVGKSSSFGAVSSLEISESAHSLVSGCVDMCFGNDFLVCLTSCRRRVAFLAGNSYFVASLDDFGVRGSFLCKLASSGERVAVSDTRGNVYRCDPMQDDTDSGKALKWVQAFSNRGAEVDHIAALAFSGSGEKLAISTVSRHIIVLNLESGLRKDFDLSTHCSSLAHSISFSENEQSILAAGQDFCMICTTEVSVKRKKRDEKRNVSKGIHVLPCKHSIIGASVMGPSRVTLVRREWQQVMSSLSDAIPKKIYGT